METLQSGLGADGDLTEASLATPLPSHSPQRFSLILTAAPLTGFCSVCRKAHQDAASLNPAGPDCSLPKAAVSPPYCLREDF